MFTNASYSSTDAVGFVLILYQKGSVSYSFSVFLHCCRQCDGLQRFEASGCAESLKHDEGKEQH